jgi:hypothetical protein
MTCKLDGKSSTSREVGEITPIVLPVVTGEVIKRELPWLFDAYAGALRCLAEELVHETLVISEDTVNAVNINAVIGAGSRYERHVDSNPVTGILYATSLGEDDGGALVFDHEFGSQITSDVIYPREGLFVAFDARRTPHRVLPLRRDCCRLSIPMNYYLAGKPQVRPADLDEYLYVTKRS